MNANELIEYYSEQLDFCKSQMYEIDCCEKRSYGEQLDEMINELNAEIDRLESLLSILSRTRIRETATEPPTREDADKWGDIIAWQECKTICFCTWSFVAEHPCFYIAWTQIPQLPEAMP